MGIYTAPLICTFRYFSSRACVSGAPAALQSKTLSASEAFGFRKMPELFSVRNSRASATVSNASSFWTNDNGSVRYLRKCVMSDDEQLDKA